MYSEKRKNRPFIYWILAGIAVVLIAAAGLAGIIITISPIIQNGECNTIGDGNKSQCRDEPVPTQVPTHDVPGTMTRIAEQGILTRAAQTPVSFAPSPTPLTSTATPMVPTQEVIIVTATSVMPTEKIIARVTSVPPIPTQRISGVTNSCRAEELGPWYPVNGGGQNVTISTGEGWIHADFWRPGGSAWENGCTEIAVLFEPNMSYIIKGVSGNGWHYNESCTRDEVVSGITYHLTIRQGRGESICEGTIEELPK